MRKLFILMAGAAFIMLTVPAFAQQAGPALVHVNGEHTIKVAPDEAEIHVMVSSENKDMQEAKKANDAIISKAIAYLKQQKIEEKNIRSTRISLYPFKEYVKDKKPEQQYRAQQSITFKLQEVERVAGLLSGLTDLGVNNIQGVDFKSSRMDEIKSEARVKAVQNAKEKAESYAGALDQKIGKAYQITDESVDTGAPRPMAMARMAMDEAAYGEEEPVAPGEISVEAKVTVSFYLE